jgi:hypothetical protein
MYARFNEHLKQQLAGQELSFVLSTKITGLQI